MPHHEAQVPAASATTGARRRTSRDPARNHRPRRAIPAPGAHQPGLPRGTALRHARSDPQDLHWIQRIAAYERAPQKYHHTVSRAWVEIVAHHVGDGPGLHGLRHLRRTPSRAPGQAPAQQALPVGHPGAPARRGWVEPDLLPFPVVRWGQRRG